MHSLQKQFHDEIITKQLFQKEDKVLLAISGGVDSMVLAHLFLSSNLSFSIAHCNFGLRGADSDKDEKLVTTWSKTNNVECHVKQFELDGSIQLAARLARYQWFEDLMQEKGYHYVATAHHLNDSFETTLINLTRGSGVKGISGISSISGQVIRPLLFATKDQLVRYAKEQGVVWREDVSNAKSDYDRNLIRNKVVPLLREMNPSLESTYKNTSERLDLTNRLLERHVENVKTSYLKRDSDHWKLTTDWIKTGVERLVLSEILSDFGFNYVTTKEIFSALNKSGKVFLSNEYELTIDRNAIFIKNKQNNRAQEDVMIAGEGQFKVGSLTLLVSLIDHSDVDFTTGGHIEYFDSKTIQFPLTIRKWKQGDRFKPLGLQGSKKVSDYLVDNKVPVAFKDDVRVVISNNEIIWLVTHQISEDHKVKPDSKPVLKLEIH